MTRPDMPPEPLSREEVGEWASRLPPDGLSSGEAQALIVSHEQQRRTITELERERELTAKYGPVLDRLEASKARVEELERERDAAVAAEERQYAAKMAALAKAQAREEKLREAVQAVVGDPEFSEPGLLEITKGQKKLLADALASSLADSTATGDSSESTKLEAEKPNG